jgi:hypothetical protein
VVESGATIFDAWAAASMREEHPPDSTNVMRARH